MEGIPEDVKARHDKRVVEDYWQEQASRRDATGNPPPGSKEALAVRPSRFGDDEDLIKRFKDHMARIERGEAPVSTAMEGVQSTQAPAIVCQCIGFTVLLSNECVASVSFARSSPTLRCSSISTTANGLSAKSSSIPRLPASFCRQSSLRTRPLPIAASTRWLALTFASRFPASAGCAVPARPVRHSEYVRCRRRPYIKRTSCSGSDTTASCSNGGARQEGQREECAADVFRQRNQPGREDGHEPEICICAEGLSSTRHMFLVHS